MDLQRTSSTSTSSTVRFERGPKTKLLRSQGIINQKPITMHSFFNRYKSTPSRIGDSTTRWSQNDHINNKPTQITIYFIHQSICKSHPAKAISDALGKNRCLIAGRLLFLLLGTAVLLEVRNGSLQSLDHAKVIKLERSLSAVGAGSLDRVVLIVVGRTTHEGGDIVLAI